MSSGTIRTYLSSCGSTVLLGDFNYTLHDNDRSNKSAGCDDSAIIFRGILEDHGMVDAVNGDLPPRGIFTHFETNSCARVDRIYVTGTRCT